jgi:hypothetical protein
MKRSSCSTAAPRLPKRRKDLHITDDDCASSDDVNSDIDVLEDADEDEYVASDDEEEVVPPLPTEKDIEPAEHMAKYAMELERFLEDPATSIPDHQAFEFAWALFHGFVAYQHVPPHFIRSRGIVDTRDFGTDLVSCDKKTAAQVKLYGANTSVDYADVAKFFTHSHHLGVEIRLLLTTPEARVTANARNSCEIEGMRTERAALNDLVTKALTVSRERDVVDDVGSPASSSSSWTWRPGQLAAAEAFLASPEMKKIFRAQLPCGYGKTALIALIIMRKLVAGDRFLVLVPWRDLLH